MKREGDHFQSVPSAAFDKGDDLQSKCEFVRSMNWGMNIDFQKVFYLLLEVAVNENMRPEHMIKKILCSATWSLMKFQKITGRKIMRQYGGSLRRRGMGIWCHKLSFGI